MRCIWYQDNNESFEEKYSVEIEKKHLELFKDAIIKSNEGDVTFSVDSDGAQTPEGSTTASASSLTPTKPSKKDSADTQVDRESSASETALTSSNQAISIFILCVSAIASLTIDSGVVTWYSKDEIYHEKTKSIFTAAFNFVKRSKIRKPNRA